MRLGVIAVLGVVMLGGCATLLTPSGSAAARWAALDKSRAAEAAGVQEEQICKRMSVIGSNLPQKVCSTKAEWDEFDRQQQAQSDDFNRARLLGDTGSTFEREQ